MTMRRSKSTVFSLAVAAVLAIAPLAAPRPAYALFGVGDIVLDPSNLVQNILTAARTLAMTVNQATQIANQVRSLANELQNLQNMPAALATQLLGDYVNAYNQLQAAWGIVNGLASNLASVTADYNALFPDRSIGPNFTPAQLQTQTQNYVTQVRRELQGVDQITAQIAADMPTQRTNLQTQLGLVQRSSGAKDVMQAQAHIQGQIVTEIAQTNALIMAMNQAQTTLSAQHVQMVEDARRRSADIRVLPPPAPANPANYMP